MPDLTPYGRDPYPTGADAAWVPGAMMAYATSVDPKLNNVATSQADRDSRYAGLPAGGIVVCPAAKTAWMSLGSNQWLTVAYDSGWQTAGFAYPDPDWGAGNWAKARQVNGVIDLRMHVLHTGLPFTVASSGDITDEVIANIPAAFRPTTLPVFGMGTFAGVFISWKLEATGDLTIVAGTPGYTYVSGIGLQLQATYLAG